MTTTQAGKRPWLPVSLALAGLALVGVPTALILAGQRSTAAPSAVGVASPPLPDAASAREVSQLQLYPDFAELRSPVQVQGQTFTLRGDSDPLLLTNTATLEGVSTLSRTLTGGEGWLAGLEGQPVTVYVNGKAMPATLIRARDLLIRDWNGKYRRITASQLAFDQPPPMAGQRTSQTLSFQTDRDGPATLNYLTRGLGWSPHYDLSLAGQQATLTALADLRNPGDQTYTVKATELISGDVNVYGAVLENAVADAQTVGTASLPTAASRTGAGQVRPIGELRGLHRFKLDQPFTLKARSTVSLPFLTPGVAVERLNTINTYFSGYATRAEGSASRSYRLKADAFLPAGAALIRDEGHVVGQASFPNTPAGKPITLGVGDDPELSYTRSMQVLQREASGARFKVTFVLKNSKSQPARVRVSENLSDLSSRVLILGGAAVREGNLATFAAELPAGATLTRSFTVDARVRTQP